MPASFYESKLGIELNNLAIDQAIWSQKVFGTDDERGPIGALKHLELEAKEAQSAPSDASEYADCFLLILDAARRAGIGPFDLLMAAKQKMEVNKSRKWSKSVGDEPSQHVRDGQDELASQSIKS